MSFFQRLFSSEPANSTQLRVTPSVVTPTDSKTRSSQVSPSPKQTQPRVSLSPECKLRIDAAIDTISQTNWEWRKNNKAKIEDAQESIRITPGALDQLVRVFSQTPGFETYKRRYLGVACVILGRKDVLLSEVRRANAKYGVGRRHSYWEEVLSIAAVFAAVEHPDGIPLALSALKDRSTAEWEAERILNILEQCMKGPVSNLPEQTLRQLLALPESHIYKHAGNSLYGDDSIDTSFINFAAIRQLAREELGRRRRPQA